MHFHSSLPYPHCDSGPRCNQNDLAAIFQGGVYGKVSGRWRGRLFPEMTFMTCAFPDVQATQDNLPFFQLKNKLDLAGSA